VVVPFTATAQNTVERLDRACMRWVVAHRGRTLDKVFVVGSHTGEKGLPWTMLLLVLRLRARGGDRLSLRRGVAITVGGWGAAHALKRLDRRRRPCQNTDASPLIACPKSSSLPSDEAACAFAAATYASAKLPRLTVPLYLGAAFTAASRVYVGVHYPTDVAAGASVGTVLARIFG
jgi:membrane-associated phospholipid phosphatase